MWLDYQNHSECLWSLLSYEFENVLIVWWFQAAFYVHFMPYLQAEWLHGLLMVHDVFYQLR